MLRFGLASLAAILCGLARHDTSGQQPPAEAPSAQPSLAGGGANTLTYCPAKINSCGTAPTILGNGVPSATAAVGFVVRCINARGSGLGNLKQGVLIYSVTGPNNAPFAGGILCLAAPIRRTITRPPAAPGTLGECDAIHGIDMNTFTQGAIPNQGPPDPALKQIGTQVWCQWIARDTKANGELLSNALTYVQGP
jgi:hypothetical protein